MIDIVKASAGSGKTFLLAKTYISLLFKSQDKYAYRHILAVTFTNKATEEMKSRILKELDILARTPEKSGYYAEFSREFGDAAHLSKKAENVLFDILHDYSSFSVSTIDKFFQTTLKSFAREIGQFSNYQVELDKTSLVKESVDRMLDSLTEDEATLLRWLTDSAMEQLEAGKKANIAESLYSIAEALKSDSHREIVEKYGIDEQTAYSKDTLKEVRKVCRECRKAFGEKVSAAAAKVLDVFASVGIDPKETNRGFAVKLYDYRDSGLCEPPTDAFARKAANSEEWFAKSKAKLLAAMTGLLEKPFADFLELFEKEYKVYSTAEILEKQIYSLGIASEFDKSFNELMKEKNVLNIDDSNTILRKIIGGTDAPFIYEKLGVWYTNFLLDEFQDTSTIQYENFRPLIGESDSNNNENLIVGDVKQSIYRWRGSDWHLLSERIKGDFPSANDSRSLQDNWRSLSNVVDFNNDFFEYTAAYLDKLFGDEAGISKIYADVRQNVKVGKDGDGVLDFTFCNKDAQLEEVYQSILRIQEEGHAEPGQIAVLVRTHAIGSEIASYLVSKNIRVISDDSLYVKSSLVVRRLVSLLHLVDNPEDTINGYLAGSLNITPPDTYHSLQDLAEELLRSLADVERKSFEDDVLYIESFVDNLSDWTSINGNNLSAFLKYWEDSNPYISSPQDPKAVRIITVHKSKGLEFPYVIFPFAESVEFGKVDSHWCHPETKDTALEALPESAYFVTLSQNTRNTLFLKDYLSDMNLQVIDNFNTLYVAFTRAEKGLHVISAFPGDKMKSMSDILCMYLEENKLDYEYLPYANDEGQIVKENYHKGTIPDFRETGRNPETIMDRDSTYPSFPLNPESENPEEDVRERGRLKFSADSVDFFMGEKSQRLKGVLLHDILSSVIVPSDLDKAVADRVRHGDISADQAVEYSKLLSERIASVAGRGWFPEDGTMVENEVSLIDIDGSVHRPDRVLINGDTVTIIDYKFGNEHEAKYLRQIGRYARLYRAMGYKNISASLWYVYENKIVPLSSND